MLFVTTRNNRDAFTVHRVLREKRSPDGGQYLPFRHPRFSEGEMESFLEQSFGACVAQILNLQFSTAFVERDIDLCLGKRAVRLETLPHRILIAQCWHMPGYRFSALSAALARRITGEETVLGGWLEIGIRIAVLFGVFSELRRRGIREADISCVSGDFVMPISAWYARQWGLPIGNIICCCNENNSLWELLAHGQLRTDSVSIPTAIPAADVTVPDQLERLVYECGGVEEALRYLDTCRRGRNYCPGDVNLARMRRGISVSVVSTQRIATMIPGVYKSFGCLMSSGTALAYAGLLDHRAKRGTTGHTVLWSEESPVTEKEKLAGLLDIPGEILGKWL